MFLGEHALFSCEGELNCFGLKVGGNWKTYDQFKGKDRLRNSKTSDTVN